MKESCIRLRRGLTAATLCAFVGLLGAPSVISAAESPGNDEVFTLKKTVTITGLERFDISWVDPTLKQYFLADRSNKTIDVIGTTGLTLDHQYTDNFAGFTGNNDTSGPDGVLTLKNTEGTEIWVGDGPTVLTTATPPATCAAHTPFPTTQGGNTFVTITGNKCSSVKVLSATGTPLKTIPTNGVARADELCFDPTDNLILVANDADTPPFISFISTKTFSVVKQVPFYQASGGIEQCQWSPKTGMFYLNLPLVGSGPDGNVLVISPKTMAVVKTFDIPVAQCAAPQGMAIGPDEQILLGCNAASPNGSFNSVVINENSGAVRAILVNLGGADEVWFNEIDDHYLISGGSHKASVSDACNQQFGIVDAEGAKVDQITCLTSAANPHSIAGDNNTGNVFVPVSEGVQVYTPSQPDDHPRFVFRPNN